MFDSISQKTWEKFFEDQKKINPFIDYGNAKDLKVEDFASSLFPTRATSKSAGYDFRSPIDFVCSPDALRILLPTGFKWNPIDSVMYTHKIGTKFGEVSNEYALYLKNAFLALYPRSSLAFKYGFRLLNTTGIIDADYYNNPDNEGHILLAIEVQREMHIKVGDKICQGVIQIYGQCDLEEEIEASRQGGFGSTGK